MIYFVVFRPNIKQDVPVFFFLFLVFKNLIANMYISAGLIFNSGYLIVCLVPILMNCVILLINSKCATIQNIFLSSLTVPLELSAFGGKTWYLNS